MSSIAYGALIIGLVDNLLRPFLIGLDTRLPDYVVLISTMGGIAIFGLNSLYRGHVCRHLGYIFGRKPDHNKAKPPQMSYPAEPASASGTKRT
jgi:hypothetical protein